MVVKLNDNYRTEIEELSIKNNCSIDELLDNIVKNYIDDLADRNAIKEAESYEDKYDRRGFTIDEANNILDRIDNGELSDEDIDKL